MIKRLKVKNFKSLKDTEIEFGKFNVLIGRNNTGKSNIIDVLRCLNEGVTNSNIFKKRGGYEEVVFGKDKTKDIEINATFEQEFYRDKILLDYYLKFKSDYYRPIEERLEIKNNGKEEIFPKSGLAVIGLFSDRISCYPLIDEKINREEIRKEIKENAERMIREECCISIFGSFLHTILYNIRSYRIIPYNIKTQVQEVFIEKGMQLDEECKNISLFLLKLSQLEKKRFERINEIISGIVEDIERFVPTIEGKYTYLKMKDKNFDKPFYSESVSEGTISLLSYITIVETANKYCTICFEEPENYIHARLLEFVVELMKKSDAQIIVTTHSLPFIELCKPEDIIIVEKEKGETKVRKIENIENVKRVLEENEIGLGELYYSFELKNE